MNNLENVTGGNDGTKRIGFTYRTVHDVVHYDASSFMTMRDAPDGNVLYTNAGN